jgi:N-methylhydantoinase B
LNLPGGGGYGTPASRDPALIEQDLEREYINPEQAAKDYNYQK